MYLQGSIRLPSSKSISNRLLIMQALSPAGFEISELSDSDDTCVLQSGLQSSSDIIDIGHAGTSMRFLTAYFAAISQEKIITGSGRMKNRPIGQLVDALNQLNAGITYLEKEGYPPVHTSGKPLTGHFVTVNGNVSSQFITSLLLIAPTLPEGLMIQIKGDLVSSSYVKMTLELMRQAGIKAQWTGNEIFITPQEYCSNGMIVEGDWSAASYWYELVALAPQADIVLENVKLQSLQGDVVVANLFRSLGVETCECAEGLRLSKSGNKSKFIEYNFINAPDIVQTMVVSACLLGIPFHFEGANTLRVKETDRIAALHTELLKLGYCIDEPKAGVLEWNGQRTKPTSNIRIATYHDHRMAMAFAPAKIAFSNLVIEDPDVVNKSYPRFWKDLEKVTKDNTL